MDLKEKNENIRCTVSECRYNMVTEDYCCRDCIQVGSHETHPDTPACVDCNSFALRSDR